MVLPPQTIHSKGECQLPEKLDILEPIEIDTFDGKVHIEWDAKAQVTPLGQLPFFIQFLKAGQRFEPWVDECPLTYTSNNASNKRDILGSILLSVLAGHTRYAHVASLTHETVNTQLLGMNKVVSDDTLRRALHNMNEEKGIQWLQSHLLESYEPLLNTPWILDSDVTIKPLYGHQECAKKGYNPHKPGRPSHTYHTYMIANLRLILDVEVQAGNKGNASHSLPGLLTLLNQLPVDKRPQFVRGDCDWGTDSVMRELEQDGYCFLFKMKKSKHVKALIQQHHGKGSWRKTVPGWEAKETTLKLSTWDKKRRIVLVRRQIKKSEDLVLVKQTDEQLDFAFMDEPEDIKAYEYAVLVTNLEDEVISIVQHYRDRADCENNFDELKNHWGWRGFTTQKVKSCRLMSRMIALIYNWWTLYTRLIEPNRHMEAITSRPLLVSGVSKLTESGRQKKLSISHSHHFKHKISETLRRLQPLFDRLKSTAPQLNRQESWKMIIDCLIAAITIKKMPELPQIPSG